MFSSISPYALLCASKPRPASSPSAYDLYSIAQHEEAAAPAPPALTLSNSALPQSASLNQQPKPERRTHYVSDIHNRHSAAFSKTALQTASISSL